MAIDINRLEAELGIPVVATVATTGSGMGTLRKRLVECTPGRSLRIEYDDFLESALEAIGNLLKGDYGFSRRTISLFLLQGDQQVEGLVREREGPGYEEIQAVVAEAGAGSSYPLGYTIALKQQREVRSILGEVVSLRKEGGRGFAERLSRAMMNPITGAPIILVVLYLGLYQFVGVFGVQTLVDFIETRVFGEWINPWVTNLITGLIPFKVIQDLFVGEYGIITLGLSYAFAIILPIVGAFFLFFSIIEDSGYLPRLAMLIDRIFKAIGLNGRAVIPLVLGFGCDTMATIVTRTQETRRERVITTFLLALAIPCSAQLGVIFAVLSGSGPALLIWAGTNTGIFTCGVPGFQGYPGGASELLYGNAAPQAAQALQRAGKNLQPAAVVLL